MSAPAVNPSAGGGPETPLDMDQVRVDPAWAMRVPASLAVRRQVLAFALVDGSVCVAAANTADAAALQALQRYIPHPLKLYSAETASLKRQLDRIYGAADAARSAAASARPKTGSEADGDDAVALCGELMSAALVRQASDVHLDPHRDELRIRFRVDGALEDYRPLPMGAHASLVSRFKVLGGMDISERRAPQDGRFTHQYGANGGQRVDVRVATLPTRYGERMTLRLLAVQTESLTLERLGMIPADLERFNDAVDRPHGLVLITGPTGSGKTTTLYAALRRLIARQPLNVITIEDPIEYEVAGVAQVEIDSADKVSFAKALRSVLRHDPDVVMIGEIRDKETADVAIKSSLTGHLVLSTVHTNSAASAVTRLADMQIDRFLIAATLRLAVAQRLVRRLCPHCRTSRTITVAEAEALGRPEAAGSECFSPRGCMYCAGRGYAGRLGLFELLPVDKEVSRLVAGGADEGELIDQLRSRGGAMLVDDGLAKVKSGGTTLEEVLSAVADW